MGCGCGRKGTPRSTGFRPAVGPIANSPNLAANQPSPAQLRALGVQNNVDPITQQRLDADRLRIEKLRREAVRRALNQ